jgi:hypothetical protein
MLALGLTKGLEGLFDSAVRVLENRISLSILATNRHNEARSGVAPQTVRPLRSRSYGQRTLGFPIRSDVAWTRLISRNPSQAPHANGCRNTVCRLLCRSMGPLESVFFLVCPWPSIPVVQMPVRRMVLSTLLTKFLFPVMASADITPWIGLAELIATPILATSCPMLVVFVFFPPCEGAIQPFGLHEGFDRLPLKSLWPNGLFQALAFAVRVVPAQYRHPVQASMLRQ